MKKPSAGSNLIDEDEILECIDETLNSVGKTVAYTVYLNWAAIDQEKHRGILGDPQAFCDSLYSLFGENNAKNIEELLTLRLERRFSSAIEVEEINGKPQGKSRFATIVTALRQRNRSDSEDF